MLDGAGFWRIFWRIVLPLSTPILVVTLIWQFTNIWNDFLYGVVFSGADSKPVTVGLNNLANTSSSVKEYNVDMAAAMIAALPTLLVYVAGRQVLRARPDRRRSQRLSMGALSIRNVRKAFGDGGDPQGHRHRSRTGRVPDPGRPLGLRQEHAAEHDRGLDHPTQGSIHIGDRDVTHALPQGPRHRDGVPELRALPQHERGAEHRLRPGDAQGAQGRARSAGAARGRDAADRAPAGPQARRSCPAASASAWPWAGRWRATPALFLFDEPLSNLDAKLRVEMRAEIKLLHQRTRTTTVYVTHDQVEAMTLGDRIAVMKDGVIQQFGSPARVAGHLHWPAGRP
jgi:hypothetical protein